MDWSIFLGFLGAFAIFFGVIGYYALAVCAAIHVARHTNEYIGALVFAVLLAFGMQCVFWIWDATEKPRVTQEKGDG